jgi:hypothetical protein
MIQGIIFLLFKMSRLALGLTQPPAQWVPATLSSDLMWLRSEVAPNHHLTPKLSMSGAIPLSPLNVFLEWSRTTLPLWH